MSLQDDIAKLAKSGVKRIVLDDLPPRPSIGRTVGVGLPSSPAATDTGGGTIRRHVITVYSHLIITADGAFERPHGWPVDGAYPAGTAIPDPLPDSLINDAGTLKLDIDVQYYEQKRVHLVVYEVGDVLQEDHLLVAFAAPYESQGQYQGLEHPSGLWAADLFLESYSGGLSEQAQTRKDQLVLAI